MARGTWHRSPRHRHRHQHQHQHEHHRPPCCCALCGISGVDDTNEGQLCANNGQWQTLPAF